MTSKVANQKFTPAERAEIQSIALAVWQEIGYDCIQGLHEMQIPGEPTRTTMTRAEVMEVVLDAGRVEERIKDPDLRNRFSKASYTQVKRMVRPVFSYEDYGL